MYVPQVLLSALAVTSPYDVHTSEWRALNATVQGRLNRGVPLSRACFERAGAGVAGGISSGECARVQAGYTSPEFRVTNFGEAINTQFEMCQKTDEGCLLDPVLPTNATAYTPPKVCHQGNVSPYYIDVRSADDARAGFRFSRRTGVPLAIKNTGHDYAGRSMAPGTLSLWTFNIKHITYDKYFVPEGCGAGIAEVPAMTYGAGQDFWSLYQFADTHNVTIIGGSAKTVGAAGGWVQGGGHSLLSNTYGLGVDRVRQFRVVTPDGVLRTANACQNTDLFWALRGGGGGTFGVVMEATSEVVPYRVRTVTLLWEYNQTPENVDAYMRLLATHGEKWARDGWGGYIYPTTSIMTHPKLDIAQATRSLKPLLEFLKSSKNGQRIGSFRWKEFDRYAPLAELIVDTVQIPIGMNFAAASRLVPANLFSPANRADLHASLVESYKRASGQLTLFFTTPYTYKATSPTSVTPEWRTSVWHALVLTVWPYDGGPSAARKAYSELEDAIEPLRELTPGGGAYHNEASVYEPDWSSSFWGSNYPKLLAVKKRYDPDGLLDCWHCVGWKGRNTPIASCYV